MAAGSVGEALGALAVPAAITVAGLAVTVSLAGLLALLSVLACLLLIGGAATRPESAFEAILGRVARLPLFAGVPGPRLEHALGRLRERPMADGDVIVRQGDAADRFYIVQAGEVMVTQVGPDGVERTLRRLGPGDVFGELGLLRGGIRTATVAAAGDGSLLELGRADFLELVGGTAALRSRMLTLYEPAGEPSG